jgi:hypothetical protein
MNFYFCETCGKRVTDAEARDKKLKGIYCQACAESVMTMEFQAVKLPAAPIQSSTSGSPPPSSANRNRKSSRINIPAAAAPLPAESRRNAKVAAKPEPLNLNLLIIGGSILVIFVVVGAMVLGKGSPPPSNPPVVTQAPLPKPLPAPAPEIRPADKAERTPPVEHQHTQVAETPAQPAMPATSDPMSTVPAVSQVPTIKTPPLERPMIKTPEGVETSTLAPTPTPPVENSEARAAADSKAQYATFWEAYSTALRALRFKDATELIDNAEKNPALKDIHEELAHDRKLMSVIVETNDAAKTGIQKLRDIDSFELRTNRNSVIKLGKKEALQFTEISEGKIIAGSKDGLSMPVPIDDLTPETRMKLAFLSFGSDAASALRHACVDAIFFLNPKDPAAFARLRADVVRAKTGGANGAEAEYLEQKLTTMEKAALEAAASATARDAWKPIETQAKTKLSDVQCAALLAQIAAWRKAHGATGFAHENEAKIIEIEKAVNEMAGPILLVQFGKTDKLNKFGLAGWNTVLQDVYVINADRGPGGTMYVQPNENGAFDFQGISGTPYAFQPGDQIIVTWVNVTADQTACTTPRVSFTCNNRATDPQSWHDMDTITLAPGATGTTTYRFTEATAGKFGVVNVNDHVIGTNALLCHKIELKAKK